MIRLETRPYCESCMDFEADVDKPSVLIGSDGVFEIVGDIVVRCKNRERCERIRNHLIRKGMISGE